MAFLDENGLAEVWRLVREKTDPLYKHWWRRRQVSSEYVLSENTQTNYGLYEATYTTMSSVFWVSSSCVANSDGTVSLVNAVKKTINYNTSDSDFAYFKNKYFFYTNGGSTGTTPQSKVWKSSADSVINKGIYDDEEGTYYVHITKSCEVTSQYRSVASAWEYVSNANANAYPSGMDGSTEYEYLGVPFDNARTPVRMVTGSYTGTGTYGENNKSSLTFDFVPKILMITGQTYVNEAQNLGGSANSIFIDYEPLIRNKGGYYASFMRSVGNNAGSCRYLLSDNNKTLTWWSTSSAQYQCNTANIVYHYIYIG